jgi:flagellar hook-basal body complex protein FliE
MSGINSVSGVGPTKWPAGISAPAGREKPPEKTDFGQVLKNYIGQVDKDQQASSEAIRQLLAGKSQDVLPVVAAVAKADLSFKLLMGVRNKVIEAYKQTMNMQI